MAVSDYGAIGDGLGVTDITTYRRKRPRGKPSGITRQDAEALARVRAWLATQSNMALEYDVLSSVIESVSEYARNAAIVRVRLLNRGSRHAHHVRLGPSPAGLTSPRMPLWGAEELARLETLYREGVTFAEISERLGRSVSAVAAQIDRLQLTRIKPRPCHHLQPSRNTPLARARAVMQERRRREVD